MRSEEKILRDIEHIKNKDSEVYLFGTGKIGTGIGYEIIKLFGIQVTYFCDNDAKKWGKIIKDGICCIPPHKLQEKKQNACFILVGRDLLEGIEKQVRQMGIETVITYEELKRVDFPLDDFYAGPFRYDESDCIKRQGMLSENRDMSFRVKNFGNRKIAVYTCIVGGYDKVYEPKAVSDLCDYYLISDQKPEKPSVWQWIDIAEAVPEWVTDPVRKNRYCKINGDRIFSEYPYSIYLDGRFKITGDISRYVSQTGKSGMAMFRHMDHQCIYKEGFFCVIFGKDDEDRIRWQLSRYKREKMPVNYGQFACGILIRENHNPLCRLVMEDWWREVFAKSYRDQLSFMYCLWKNGLNASDVGCLEGDWSRNRDFWQNGHNP